MSTRKLHYPPSWLTRLIVIFSGTILLFVTVDGMLGELSLLSFAARIFAAPIEPIDNQRLLRFTSEGTFQISIFEDLHYGEGK